jgi:hypothetical protein
MISLKLIISLYAMYSVSLITPFIKLTICHTFIKNHLSWLIFFFFFIFLCCLTSRTLSRVSRSRQWAVMLHKCLWTVDFSECRYCCIGLKTCLFCATEWSDADWCIVSMLCCTHTHLYTRTHTYTHIYTRTHTHIHTHTRAVHCMLVVLHTHARTHTHTHTALSSVEYV